MLKFIVDENVGKLAGWLRMLGFDTVFFSGGDDSVMVKQALAEDRILLTRDTGIMKRRVVQNGQLETLFFQSEDPEEQIKKLLAEFDLLDLSRPFTLCLEDNSPLVEKTPGQVKDRVPPFVFQTQEQYMECPLCARVYWRGTHWQAMRKKLEELANS